MGIDKNKKGFVPQEEEFYQEEKRIDAAEPPAGMPQGASAEQPGAGIATPAPREVELTPEQQLAKSNAALIDATGKAHDAGIQSMADLLQASEEARKAKIKEDADYQRRENAYRYISGLGDTFSGIANLIGTAHGAANQKQYYNSPEIVRKAEEARRRRKKNIDDLGRRIDEQKQRLGDLKSARSLAEAQQQAKAERDQLELRLKLASDAQKQKNWEAEQERLQGNADRDYNLSQQRLAQSKVDSQRSYNLQLGRFNEEKKRYGAKNPTSYPIMLGESGEILDIPIANINDANVSQIFNSIPEEYRSLAQGKAVTTYDEYGNRQTSYAEPDTEAKLAAIGVAAGADADVQNLLRQLAGQETVKKDTPTASGTDWNAYKVGGGQQVNDNSIPSAPANAPSAMGAMWDEGRAKRKEEKIANAAARKLGYARGKEEGKANMLHALASSKL